MGGVIRKDGTSGIQDGDLHGIERASSVGVVRYVRFGLGDGLSIYSPIVLYKLSSSRGFSV